MPSIAPGVLRCWFQIAGYYAASFAVLGVYMQFFPVWLHEARGLGEQDVAIVMAAQTIARTVAGPFWSHRVDRLGDARRVLVWLSCASLPAFALFGASTAVPACCVAAFVFGSLYSPSYPILDAAAMQAAHERGFAFGRVRMVGSLAYLVILLGSGSALDALGIAAVYPALLVGLGMMALAAFALPASAPHGAGPAPAGVPWWTLLRSRQFVLLLAASAAIQGSHATFYNLSTVHWGAHGISKTTASWLWAEGIVAEIVVFALGRSVAERVRPTTLMLLGGAGAVVRWLLVGSVTSVPLLFATNWLHGLSFAATYIGTLRALERRVAPGQRATAQGLLGAATSGIGMVVCGLLGGAVYQRAQGAAFHVMAGFAVLGIGVTWLVRRAADRGATAGSSS